MRRSVASERLMNLALTDLSFPVLAAELAFVKQSADRQVAASVAADRVLAELRTQANKKLANIGNVYVSEAATIVLHRVASEAVDGLLL